MPAAQLAGQTAVSAPAGGWLDGVPSAVWVAVIITLSVVLGWTFWSGGEPSETSVHAPIMVSVPLGEYSSLSRPSLSDDGKYLAFVGVRDARSQTIIKDLITSEVKILGPSSSFGVPEISPDSRWLIQQENGGAMRYDIRTGEAVQILTVGDFMMPFMSPSSFIMEQGGSIGQWSVDGEFEGIIFEPDTLAGHAGLTPVQVLGNGRKVLMNLLLQNSEKAIAIGEVGTGSYTVLEENAWYPRYVGSGHLTYLKNVGTGTGTRGTLLARPFDLESEEFVGNSVSLIPEPILWSDFDVSLTGQLVLTLDSVVQSEGSRLFEVDLNQGTVTPMFGGETGFRNPRFSSDGSRLAYTKLNRSEGYPDVWILDMDSGLDSRISFGGRTGGVTWSPQDTAVVYYQHLDRADWYRLRSRVSDGSAPQQPIGVEPMHGNWPSFSRDGSTLAYVPRALASEWDIVVMTMPGFTDARILERRSSQGEPALNTDGRFVAYTTQENGYSQIFVQEVSSDTFWEIPTPAESTKWQPGWSTEDDFLYFLSDNQLFRIPVQTQPTFRATGVPEPVTLVNASLASIWSYTIHPEGSSIVVAGEPDQVREERIPDAAAQMRLHLDEYLRGIAPRSESP